MSSREQSICSEWNRSSGNGCEKSYSPVEAKVHKATNRVSSIVALRNVITQNVICHIYASEREMMNHCSKIGCQQFDTDGQEDDTEEFAQDGNECTAKQTFQFVDIPQHKIVKHYIGN